MIVPRIYKAADACAAVNSLSEMFAYVVLALSLLAFAALDPIRGGSCPPTLSVDVCEGLCSTANPCVNATQLCCPTDCGGAMCVDAVTKRHFEDVVKPGRCPENPRGVWVCSHMCTSDSDCPRALKCCANRCGAFVCQKPTQE
ncbi:WAP four-disulfide core domain protein 2-like [Leguminivora glycinivorella]|uniref:WAP four-disulfide core domain protein 2-like n=1 Tax=Leguminivora glycinivorella TaxID=1035111 RepID=UPI00200DC2BC|nr:WAP four-disulfide core domain protein 2-like [Leguminivora glycinivorella]